MAKFNALTCPLAIEAKKAKHRLHTAANSGPRLRSTRMQPRAMIERFDVEQLKLYQWLSTRTPPCASLDHLKHKVCVRAV